MGTTGITHSVMSWNVAERHHVSWHKKHMEPVSICEQCCNASKIKCGKASRTPSRGLFVFFSSNTAFGWFLAAFGLPLSISFSWSFWLLRASLHISMDRFSEGWWWRCVMLSADVPFPVMIPLFMTFYHWLDVRDRELTRLQELSAWGPAERLNLKFQLGFRWLMLREC